jgi:hypothetical protein
VSLELSPLDELEQLLDELLALLDASGERYWSRHMRRAREGVAANRLAGVSRVLAAYGGEDTFSDLELLVDSEDGERRLLANRRLERLRNRIHELADGIASGTARGP